jgi:hypothetical protein
MLLRPFMSLKLYASKLGHCPRCKSPRIRRSIREGPFEALRAHLFGYWPYRCIACDLRYFDRRRLVDPTRSEEPTRDTKPRPLRMPTMTATRTPALKAR